MNTPQTLLHMSTLVLHTFNAGLDLEQSVGTWITRVVGVYATATLSSLNLLGMAADKTLV